jgi:hypothetical protein
MSRCLSEKALLRVLAELASGDERAHLATCSACAARRRALSVEMETIARVLATTPEPRMQTVRATWRWVPAAAALAAAAVGALLWIEVAAWKAIQPVPDPPRTQELATALADLSSALFSMDGEPDHVLAEGVVEALEQDDERDAICDGPMGFGEVECADALSDAEATTDPAEIEATLSSSSIWSNTEQGG